MTQTTVKPKIESSHQESSPKIYLSLNYWQLKYRSDLYPLLMLVSVALIQFSVFFFCKQLKIASAVAFALLFPQLILSIAVHNQAHIAMFRGSFPNWVINILFFLETGMRVVQFQIQHNLGHHCFYLDPDRSKDPAALAEADGSTMSRWKFMVRDIFLYIPDTMRIGKPYPHLLKRWYLELAICLAIPAILLILDPLKTLIVFLTPILLSRRLFMLIVYEDHVDLSIEDAYGASHTKKHSLANLLTFNNGYHLAHHLRPSLHWSKLPQFHQKIESKITAVPSQTFLNQRF
ncbi:MAG: fatty acid desaturase [Cyanobacteria bacterium J06555_3]